MATELFLSRTGGHLWAALRADGTTVELRVESEGRVIARHRPRGRRGRLALGRVTLDLSGARGAPIRIVVSDDDARGRIAVDDLRWMGPAPAAR